MKNFKIAVLVCALVFALSACGTRTRTSAIPGGEAPMQSMSPPLAEAPIVPAEADVSEAPAGSDVLVAEAETKLDDAAAVIGEYRTKILDQTANRVKNIDLTVGKLDGVYLQPGEEFSFNGVVGERKQESGFKLARALWGKKKVEEVGGGVCQVSSTIYQAAVEAGFEITERHQHQKAVDYIEEGKDATVDYGVFDLKFKNTRDKPARLGISRDKENQYLNVQFTM